MSDYYDLMAGSYPEFDWNLFDPWSPSKSQIVDTVFGPAYTPQQVTTPIYNAMWPYTPAEGASYNPTTASSGYSYTMGSTPASSSSSYYSSGYSGGGGSGDIEPGPTLPIWDPYYALMNLLPPPSATPQEQYSYYTAPGMQQLGEQIMPIVYSGVKGPGGNKFPSWEEIRDQTKRIIDTTASWAPGGQNVPGKRRTVAQQAEYEKAMNPLWNWVAPLPPITGSGDAMNDIQRRQAYEQQAWDLWKPALQQLLGPDTMKGGSPNWLRGASNVSGAGPYRQRPADAGFGSGSSWSFAPRWG